MLKQAFLKSPFCRSVVVLSITTVFNAMATPPQHDTPSKRSIAVLEQDVLDGMGFWVKGQLLLNERSFLESQSKTTSAEDYKAFRPTADDVILYTGIGAFIAATWTSFAYYLALDYRGAASTRQWWRFFLAAEGVNLLLSSSAAGTSAFISTDIGKPRNQFEAGIQKLAVPNRVKAIESQQSEAENAKLQAKFVAELKESARIVSDRMGRTLGLDEFQKVTLKEQIEDEAMKAFRSEEAWHRNSKVTVNVDRILRRVVIDAQTRFSLVDGAIASALRAPSQPIKTPGDLKAVYSRLEDEAAGMLRSAVQAYDQFRVVDEPVAKTMAKKYFEFSRDLSVYQKRLKSHAALID